MQKTVIGSRPATAGIDPSRVHAGQPDGVATRSGIAPARISVHNPRTSRIDADWDTPGESETVGSAAPAPIPIVAQNPRTSFIDADWDTINDFEPATTSVRQRKSLEIARPTTEAVAVVVEKLTLDPAPVASHSAELTKELPQVPPSRRIAEVPKELPRVAPSRRIVERLLLLTAGIAMGAGLLFAWSVINIAGYSDQLKRSVGSVSAIAVHRPAPMQPTVTHRAAPKPPPVTRSDSSEVGSTVSSTPPQPSIAELGGLAQPIPPPVGSPTLSAPMARTGKLARNSTPPVSRVRRATVRRRTPVADDNPY